MFKYERIPNDVEMTTVDKKNRKEQRKESGKDYRSMGFNLVFGGIYGFVKIFVLMALWLLFFAGMGVGLYFLLT